ncbi:MAG: hypothetical protein P4M08_13905 [Oligoflexia bacterium]|nr:hypothetical protein [Oligoflexia bacterium]
MKWVWMCIIWMSFIALLWSSRRQIEGSPIWIPLAEAAGERSVSCDEKVPQSVRVTFGRITVINFPFKPSDVVPGQMSFDFKRIKNDLVIKAMKSQARTNLLVYLEDRRCAFDLITVPNRGDDILIVKDPKDDQIEVKFNE